MRSNVLSILAICIISSYEELTNSRILGAFCKEVNVTSCIYRGCLQRASEVSYWRCQIGILRCQYVIRTKSKLSILREQNEFCIKGYCMIQSSNLVVRHSKVYGVCILYFHSTSHPEVKEVSTTSKNDIFATKET